MKLKMLLVASVGVSFVLGAGFIGCRQQPPPPVRIFTADSPLDMGGGSIYGIINGGQTWTKTPGKKSREYTTTSTNIDQLFVVGVPTATSPIPSLPNGWKIVLASANDKTDAVTICPDPDCKAGSLSGKQTIYLKTRDNSRWSRNPQTNQLRYHDNDCDGDDENGTSEEPEPGCDYLMTVKILDSQGNQVVSGPCTDGRCTIGIGKP